jgi:hypothetical protein
MFSVLIAIGLIWFVCTLIDSASDSTIGATKVSFDSLCKESKVITITSWIGGTHATNESGKRIRVERGFPNLISTAAKYGLYPTTCDVDGGMMTLVKNSHK